MTAALMQSVGGYLIVVKNLEGDILSEVVANGFSNQNLMINESRGAKGEYLFETNHGELSHDYHNMIEENEKCYCNPSATIYVWAKALERRAISDHNLKLKSFVTCLID